MKPKRTSYLGRVLADLLRGRYSKFEKQREEILRYQPNWAVTRKQNRKGENKRQLLEMAINGEARPPSRKTSLGDYLKTITCKKSSNYDEQFTNELRHIRPDWFSFDTFTRHYGKQWKLQEIKLFGNQELEYNKLYWRYDWFPERKLGASAVKSKKEILDFVKKYGRIPNKWSKDSEERRLGILWRNYSAPSHSCYDPLFKEEVNKIRKGL